MFTGSTNQQLKELYISEDPSQILKMSEIFWEKDQYIYATTAQILGPQNFIIIIKDII